MVEGVTNMSANSSAIWADILRKLKSADEDKRDRVSPTANRPCLLKELKGLLESKLTLEITAYHEAGHVVGAYLVRTGVAYVSIRPGDGTLGLGRTLPTRPFEWAGELSPKLADQQSFILWAGDAVEKIEMMTDLIDQDDPNVDRFKLDYIALRLCGGNWEQAAAYLCKLGLVTRDTFRLPPVRAAVHALAQRLLLKPRILWGHAARRVIRDALYNFDACPKITKPESPALRRFGVVPSHRHTARRG